MSAHVHPRLTEDQYLELERASQERHEFYDGQMYAMSGTSHRHGIILSNLSRQLGNRLAEKPCVVTTSDLRVRIDKRRMYAYPDLVIVCGQSHYADGELDTLLNPGLLIEVLSPSTESYDRGFKSAQFREIESLQEYALVAQKEARVEIYRRQTTGGWLLTEAVGLEDTCHFTSIECSIPMREIYLRVEFDEKPDVFPPPGTVR